MYGSSARKLVASLKELNVDAQDYLGEADKTGGYYILVSDLSIQLEDLFGSLEGSLERAETVNDFLASVDDFSLKLKTMGEKLQDASSSLPGGMDAANKDLISILSLVSDYFDEIKQLTIRGDRSGIIRATNTVTRRLTNLAISVKNNEISFWRNTTLLNLYEDLSGSFTDNLKNLEETRKNNSLFILN